MDRVVMVTLIFFAVLIPLAFVSAYFYSVWFPVPNEPEMFNNQEDMQALEALYIDSHEK